MGITMNKILPTQNKDYKEFEDKNTQNIQNEDYENHVITNKKQNEEREIVLDESGNVDEEFEAKNSQNFMFGCKSQNENNIETNHVVDSRKRAIVLCKSGVRNSKASNINFERMWKSSNRFINIAKLNRAKILKKKSNINTYKRSEDFFQYSGDQLLKIRLTNVDLNCSHYPLPLQDLLSERLNRSCSSIILREFIQNTFPEFNHPIKIRDFVIYLAEDNTSIKTEGIMKELWRIYKKHKALSSQRHYLASKKDYCNYEIDIKMFLRFLFENLFNIEIKSGANSMISHEDVSYDKKKKLSNRCCCFANSNHHTTPESKMTDVKCGSNSTYQNTQNYSWHKDIPQIQYFMKESTSKISSLENKKLSIDDHMTSHVVDICNSQENYQNPEYMYLQDCMKDSASKFDPQLSLSINKKKSIDNQMLPYLADPCYSQANYQNTDDTCLQDFLKESDSNFEFQAPLLVNKKSLNVNEILPDFAQPYCNKTQYQYPDGIPSKELIDNYESCTPILIKKKDLIDYHIPPDLVYPCYSQRKNENSEDRCRQDITKESAGIFELHMPLLVNTKNFVSDQIPQDPVTNIFASNIKILHHSKHYYKVYYKHLIDQNFYKLRRETRRKISNTKISKLNRVKQYCNDVSDNVNSDYNVANKDDKALIGIFHKNNTSNNNLLLYGFYNVTSNISNTSALPKVSENFNSSLSKTKSSNDISDIFLLIPDSLNVAVQPPTFKINEKHMLDIMPITDPRAEIFPSRSGENSEFNDEVCKLRTVPSYSNSCNNLDFDEKAFMSLAAVVKSNQECRQRLFGDVKIDNVKRVFNILGPTFKPDVLSTLNSINKQNAETSQISPTEFNECKSFKRKLLSDPKVDDVKRVHHILDPR